MIPLIDLTLPKSLNNQIKKEVVKVIDSQNYILGAQVELFEKKFAAYIGTRYAIGVGNGTDAYNGDSTYQSNSYRLRSGTTYLY